MSKLLSPVNIAQLQLKNHVVMSPMCMYEVQKEDGIPEAFHFAHYGARAIGQVGMIITESTAVDPAGRITKHDLGLWNDQQMPGYQKLVDYLHGFGTKVGIQINHAGRKAEDANQPVAPSAIAFNEDYQMPAELTIDQIHEVRDQFIAAAQRAQTIGADMIEIHGAHGYLLNQFLSPLTNHRHDEYGGSLANRYRLVKEIVQGIRQNYAGSLWIRLSLTAYDDSGVQNNISDWQQVGKWLENDGIDLIDVSTGGLINAKPNIPIYDGYQVPFATAMKQAISIPVSTVGLLDNPGICESILQNEQADLILEGRALIRNANWLADAAHELHDHQFTAYNPSYQRGQRWS